MPPLSATPLDVQDILKAVDKFAQDYAAQCVRVALEEAAKRVVRPLNRKVEG